MGARWMEAGSIVKLGNRVVGVGGVRRVPRSVFGMLAQPPLPGIGRRDGIAHERRADTTLVTCTPCKLTVNCSEANLFPRRGGQWIGIKILAQAEPLHSLDRILRLVKNKHIQRLKIITGPAINFLNYGTLMFISPLIFCRRRISTS